MCEFITVNCFPCAYCIQAPGINWTRIVENLDHEGFFVSSEEAFSFLMSVYKHACKVFYQNVGICVLFIFSPGSQFSASKIILREI